MGGGEKDVHQGREDQREETYLEWLSERLGEAAAVTSGRMARFSRRAMVRGARSSTAVDAILQGDLEIGDPAKFAAMLGQGIGRHKAYGYGMLILRPPSTQN